jgi:hypothetical protein
MKVLVVKIRYLLLFNCQYNLYHQLNLKFLDVNHVIIKLLQFFYDIETQTFNIIAN